MADVEVIGAQKFVELSLAIKAMGKEGGGLRRELNKRLKAAAAPLEAVVMEHISHYMPSGYAPVLAATLQIKPSSSTRGASAGLHLTGYAKGSTRRRRVRTLDQGILRHPVYGNREVWVTQRIRPGFWSEPLDAHSEIPLREIQRAVQEVANKLGRG